MYDIGVGGDPIPTDHTHHKIGMGLCHGHGSYMKGEKENVCVCVCVCEGKGAGDRQISRDGEREK